MSDRNIIKSPLRHYFTRLSKEQKYTLTCMCIAFFTAQRIGKKYEKECVDFIDSLKLFKEAMVDLLTMGKSYVLLEGDID